MKPEMTSAIYNSLINFIHKYTHPQKSLCGFLRLRNIKPTLQSPNY